MSATEAMPARHRAISGRASISWYRLSAAW